MDLKTRLDKVIPVRHHLVLDEEDVVKALKVIQQHHRIVPDMAVGNCGWADDLGKWFIHFTTTECKWEEIRKKLNVVRVYGNADIPNYKKGVIYSTD